MSALRPTGVGAASKGWISRIRPRGWLDWICKTAGFAVLGLVGLGAYQAFVARTPATEHLVTIVQPAVPRVPDVWRSHGNGAVRLTSAAVVLVEPEAIGGQKQARVLFDAPIDAKAGDRLAASVSLDGRQVRVGALPGPAVLPGGQGIALIVVSVGWVVLRLVRRRARSFRTT